MSDRTPPGINPGSNGRGTRTVVYLILAFPVVVLVAGTALVLAFM